MEEDEDAPHPLRTAEWRMSTRKLLGFKREDEYFTFHKDGTVESPGKADGRWWFDVGGLHWELKEPSATATHYRAELHWNIFGTQPRMFRGTVTRDRSPSSFMPPWLLRPVISTFTGYGIGDDTADTTYKHRQSESFV
ncbi:hypothetical protein JKP88DRAFT_351503 [Tribonema minus]|uniref:Uncharacterized protein n=1 Tax=Tribonema minus TaxID=303371 RepID=A0A835YRW5_9STRA|nr:hypothetical protein JKP88DRAFT_351503 [Tribonema minus]